MKKNSNPIIANKMFLIQKTKSLYNEYKKFINCDSLPNYELYPFNFLTYKDRFIGNAINAKVEFKNNIPVLSVEENIFTLRPQTANSILFHEFTHIWDEITYLQNLNYEDRKFILHSYTEYHATYVQMMCACNFENINDYKILDENTIVYNETKPLNIKEYINSLAEKYILTIKNIIFKDFKEIDTLNIIIFAIYFQSEIDFFNKYCSFDINELLNPEIVIDLFGDNFYKLSKLLREPQQNDTVEWFEEQNKLRLLTGTDIHKNRNKIRNKITKLNI